MSRSVDTPSMTTGAELHAFAADLFPICRSITGDGVRETLKRMQQYLPLSVKEVPTGKPVFDWTVPREWNIRDAWIKNAAGQRVVDFQQSSLHVVSYSTPVRARMSLADLRPHLHTLPDHPTWIPYKTSYYAESWGFCLSANQLDALTEGEYEVCIDSTLEDGHLTYGEFHLPGDSQEEVLLSCHVCHPSLCNDNLSGITIAIALGKWLSSQPARRLSYRLVFVPGTIGSITWLAENQARLPLIRHGLVLAGLGGPGPLVYKRSRREDAHVDRVVEWTLSQGGEAYDIRPFVPYGYDERQYCSPGINLPVGRLSRTPYGEYAEYHTSADNLDYVEPDQLERSLRACERIIETLEGDRRYINLSPMCEPQLGRRQLYSATGGAGERRTRELALLWVLNQSDGEHSLLDIATRSEMPFAAIRDAADQLERHGLLRVATQADSLITEDITRGNR